MLGSLGGWRSLPGHEGRKSDAAARDPRPDGAGARDLPPGATVHHHGPDQSAGQAGAQLIPSRATLQSNERTPHIIIIMIIITIIIIMIIIMLIIIILLIFDRVTEHFFVVL